MPGKFDYYQISVIIVFFHSFYFLNIEILNWSQAPIYLVGVTCPEIENIINLINCHEIYVLKRNKSDYYWMYS